MLYKKIIRPIFFKIDPERVHHIVIFCLGFVSRIGIIRKTIKRFLFVYDKSLEVDLGSLKLKNPIGLAAGFDKYIDAPLSYPMLGFGYAELGSITYSAQLGNQKPRMWRLPKDGGLIVYYGLSNDGIKETKKRILKKMEKRDIPYGISIAPTTGLLENQLLKDYLDSFLEIYDCASYIVFNVSCPNVVSLKNVGQIDFILELIQKINSLKIQKNIKKDIYLKISSEMETMDLDKLVDACLKNGITGVIATNLCKKRENLPECNSKKCRLDNPGGVSGSLLRERSNKTIRQVYKKSQGKLKIIGVGGVFTAEDAYEKIKCGANAVQLVTGFIYGGPLSIRKINKGVVKLLKQDGFTNISEAVGINL